MPDVTTGVNRNPPSHLSSLGARIMNDGAHFIGLDGNGLPVRSRPRTHLLVCGPSQTGKTASILSHAVKQSTGATVTASTKDDLARLSPAGTAQVLDLIGGTNACEGAISR